MKRGSHCYMEGVYKYKRVTRTMKDEKLFLRGEWANERLEHN